MPTDRTQTINQFGDWIEELCKDVNAYIELCFENNERPQITVMANQLKEKYDIHYNSMYHIIKLFIERSDDLKSRPGPNGGVIKVENKGNQ